MDLNESTWQRVTEWLGVTKASWNKLSAVEQKIRVDDYLAATVDQQSIFMDDNDVVNDNTSGVTFDPNVFSLITQNLIPKTKLNSSKITDKTPVGNDKIENKININNTNANTNTTQAPANQQNHANNSNSNSNPILSILSEPIIQQSVQNFQTTVQNNKEHQRALNAQAKQHSTYPSDQKHSDNVNIKLSQTKDEDLTNNIYLSFVNKLPKDEVARKDKDKTPENPNPSQLREMTPILLDKEKTPQAVQQQDEKEEILSFLDDSDDESEGVSRRSRKRAKLNSGAGIISRQGQRESRRRRRDKGRRLVLYDSLTHERVQGGNKEEKAQNRATEAGENGNENENNSDEKSQDQKENQNDQNGQDNQNGDNGNGNHDNQANQNGDQGAGNGASNGSNGNGDNGDNNGDQDHNGGNNGNDGDQQGNQQDGRNVAGNGGDSPHPSDKDGSEDSFWSNASSLTPKRSPDWNDPEEAQRYAARLRDKAYLLRGQRDSTYDRLVELNSKEKQKEQTASARADTSDKQFYLTLFKTALETVQSSIKASNTNNNKTISQKLEFEKQKKFLQQNLETYTRNFTEKYSFNGNDVRDTGRFWFGMEELAKNLGDITDESVFTLWKNTVVLKFTSRALHKWQSVKQEEYNTFEKFMFWYSTTFRLHECYRHWHRLINYWTAKDNVSWREILTPLWELKKEYENLRRIATTNDKFLYYHRPNQMGDIAYRGLTNGAKSKAKELKQHILDEKINPAGLTLKEFERMVIKPLYDVEQRSRDLNVISKKNTKPPSTLKPGRQVAAMHHDSAPQKRTPYKYRYKERYQKPHGGKKGHYYDKYSGSGKSKYHGKSKRSFTTKHGNKKRERKKDKYGNYLPIKRCYYPSGKRYDVQLTQPHEVKKWMKNWDIEALYCDGKCYKCFWYGHFRGICHLVTKFNKLLVEDLYYQYCNKHGPPKDNGRQTDLDRKTKQEKIKRRRERRHANVAQKGESGENNNKQKDSSINQSNNTSTAQVNTLQATNIQSIQSNQNQSQHINMVQTSQQNEQTALKQASSQQASSNQNLSSSIRSLLKPPSTRINTSSQLRRGSLSHTHA